MVVDALLGISAGKCRGGKSSEVLGSIIIMMGKNSQYFQIHDNICLRLYTND